jgi:hypothetical protein
LGSTKACSKCPEMRLDGKERFVEEKIIGLLKSGFYALY